MTAAADALARDVEGIYKILQLPVVTNTQLVPLPRHILHVREARLITAQIRLRPMNIGDVGSLPSDDYGMRVENQFWTSKGVPRFFVRDYDRRGVLLAPIPTSDDTIEMQCTTSIGAPLERARSLKKRLTMRSSSEWKVTTTRRPPGLSARSAACSVT